MPIAGHARMAEVGEGITFQLGVPWVHRKCALGINGDGRKEGSFVLRTEE